MESVRLPKTGAAQSLTTWDIEGNCTPRHTRRRLATLAQPYHPEGRLSVSGLGQTPKGDAQRCRVSL